MINNENPIFFEIISSISQIESKANVEKKQMDESIIFMTVFSPIKNI